MFVCLAVRTLHSAARWRSRRSSSSLLDETAPCDADAAAFPALKAARICEPSRWYAVTAASALVVVLVDRVDVPLTYSFRALFRSAVAILAAAPVPAGSAAFVLLFCWFCCLLRRTPRVFLASAARLLLLFPAALLLYWFWFVDAGGYLNKSRAMASLADEKCVMRSIDDEPEDYVKRLASQVLLRRADADFK